jgi:hypothetical protein
MKNLLTATLVILTTTVFAQIDTTTKKVNRPISIEINTSNLSKHNINLVDTSIFSKKKNVSTNWWVLDFGFCNLRDNTDYNNTSGYYFKTINNRPRITKNSFKLNEGKSSNVNLWFFIQKMNVYKRILNLKYGLGLEMYNYRYENNLSFRKDENSSFVFNDSVSFSKNKLFISYLTVPFMININTKPTNKGLSISAGVSAGYLLRNRNKQISEQRGKVKYDGSFDLQPFRIAAIGELGMGRIRLYGSYSLNNLYNDDTKLQQFPYTIGFRLGH